MSGSWYVFLYTAKGYKYLHPIFKRRNLRVLTHVELKMQWLRQADICSASSAVEVACRDGEHEENSWEQSLDFVSFYSGSHKSLRLHCLKALCDF